jgi:Protein of unknown function (DUF2490)
MVLKCSFMVLLAGGALSAADWYDQLWPETNVYVGTGQQSRLFFLVAATRTRHVGYSDGQLGVHMDFYVGPFVEQRTARHPNIARQKFLMFRAGYLYGKTPADSPDPFTEHTAVIEMVPRFFLPKQIHLSNRNRGDLRFLDGSFVPRYRNRLKIERTFAIARRSVTPYGHAEAFYDWRYTAFHRIRYAAGSELEINKRIVLEAYLLHQRDSRSAERIMNVLGVSLQVYLH